MKSLGFCCLPSVAAVILASAPMVFAADADQSSPKPKTTESEMEAKIKMLEGRIQTLEDQLANAAKTRKNEVSNDWREFQRRRFGRDFDDMLDQLQRELNQGFGNFGQNFEPQIPFNTRSFSNQKPRLGVEMAPASPEYRERFKNDAKEGAFVLEVVPGSPAEKAGVMKGDCIESFAGKPVKSPEELKDAVIDAPQGKNEMVVKRRGESVALKVDLGEMQAEEPVPAAPNTRAQGGWLRRGDLERGANPGANQTSRTDVKASALELTGDLEKELNLTDEQHKKMSDVLAKQSQLLGEDVAKSENTFSGRRGNSFNFRMNNNVNAQVEKRVAEAEKELAGTLTPDQLNKWKAYRQTHNSLSVSHSETFENSGGVNNNTKDDKGTGF